MGNFGKYAAAGLVRDINTHFSLKDGAKIEDNWISKVGKLLEWPITQLPREVWHSLHNPRVLTVALTVLAMIAVQFAFYPVATALVVKAAAVWIAAHLSYSTVHFGMYLLAMGFVLGNGLLAFGRFSNQAVLDRLAAPSPDASV